MDRLQLVEGRRRKTLVRVGESTGEQNSTFVGKFIYQMKSYDLKKRQKYKLLCFVHFFKEIFYINYLLAAAVAMASNSRNLASFIFMTLTLSSCTQVALSSSSASAFACSLSCLDCKHIYMTTSDEFVPYYCKFMPFNLMIRTANFKFTYLSFVKEPFLQLDQTAYGRHNRCCRC